MATEAPPPAQARTGRRPEAGEDDTRQVEQQSYRTCRALIGLGERNGDDVLEEACAKANAISSRPTYKTVKTIVSQLAAQRKADPDEHAYLRGADYYRSLDGEDVM